MPYRSEFLQPSVVKCGRMNFEYSFWVGAVLQGMSREHPFAVQEGAVRSGLSVCVWAVKVASFCFLGGRGHTGQYFCCLLVSVKSTHHLLL